MVQTIAITKLSAYTQLGHISIFVTLASLGMGGSAWVGLATNGCISTFSCFNQIDFRESALSKI